MKKKIFSRIIALVMIMCNIFVSIIYASDVVVVAGTPVNFATGTNVAGSNMINGMYAQNMYGGPTGIPSSGVAVAYSNTANLNDINGTRSVAPTTHNLSSPSAKPVATLLAAVNGTSNIITNGIDVKNKESKTADIPPTVYEDIISPGDHEKKLAKEGKADIIGPGGTNISNNSPGGSSNEVVNEEKKEDNINNTLFRAYTAREVAVTKPSISAPAGIVVNAGTREIYFSKEGFKVFSPAALANMVTAYLLVNSRQLTDTLTVTSTALSGIETDASTAGLKAGDTITVKDALYAMAVKNCCDVSNVVAENVGGSIPNFVALMNQTVKNFGCLSTNFVNANGLYNDAQVTTVYDMAIILDVISNNQTLLPAYSVSSYVLPKTNHRDALTIYTKDTLITKGSSNYTANIIASHMGYTSKSKYTIASVGLSDNMKLLIVVLASEGSQFSDTKKLLEFGINAGKSVGANNANVNTYINNNVTSNATNNNQAINGEWKQDTNGWYFVKSNNEKAINEWITLNNKKYCVDANGYMITGWREFTNGKIYYFDPTNGELRYNTWINTTTGSYYLQSDGSLAKASAGQTMNITTGVGVYTIDENGKAVAKVS